MIFSQQDSERYNCIDIIKLLQGMNDFGQAS